MVRPPENVSELITGTFELRVLLDSHSILYGVMSDIMGSTDVYMLPPIQPMSDKQPIRARNLWKQKSVKTNQIESKRKIWNPDSSKLPYKINLTFTMVFGMPWWTTYQRTHRSNTDVWVSEWWWNISNSGKVCTDKVSMKHNPMCQNGDSDWKLIMIPLWSHHMPLGETRFDSGAIP